MLIYLTICTMWEPTVCQGYIYMDALWWYFQSQTKKYSQMIIKRLLFSGEQGSPFRRPFHSYSFSKFFLPHLNPGDFTPLNVSSKKMVWNGDQAIKMFTNNIQWHQYYKWFLSLEVYKSTLGDKNDLEKKKKKKKWPRYLLCLLHVRHCARPVSFSIDIWLNLHNSIKYTLFIFIS